jgi:hypothetical protein
MMMVMMVTESCLTRTRVRMHARTHDADKSPRTKISRVLETTRRTGIRERFSTDSSGP